MVQVSTRIEDVIGDSLGDSGTEISGSDFLSNVTQFLSIANTSFVSTKVSSMALSIIMWKVDCRTKCLLVLYPQVTSLSADDKTSLTETKVTLLAN